MTEAQDKKHQYCLHPRNKMEWKTCTRAGKGIFLWGYRNNSNNGINVILESRDSYKTIRIIRIKLVISGKMYSIISAYAPQAGLTQQRKTI